MISMRDIDQIIGAEAVDDDDDRIGKVGQVYVEEGTENPTWVSVRSGLFGMSETLVPLDGAEWDSTSLHLAVSKEQVKEAPRVDPDAELSPTEQADLYAYYGLGDVARADGAAQQDAMDAEDAARQNVNDDEDAKRSADRQERKDERAADKQYRQDERDYDQAVDQDDRAIRKDERAYDRAADQDDRAIQKDVRQDERAYDRALDQDERQIQKDARQDQKAYDRAADQDARQAQQDAADDRVRQVDAGGSSGGALSGGTVRIRRYVVTGRPTGGGSTQG